MKNEFCVRLVRTVRGQFLVEVAHSEVPSLAVLEDRFAAWLETSYHRREHSESKEAPIERFSRLAKPVFPGQAQLREALLFSEARTVTKFCTVSLHGNSYEVDAALVGRRVELIVDPLRGPPRNGSYVRGRVMSVAALESVPSGLSGGVVPA